MAGTSASYGRCRREGRPGSVRSGQLAATPRLSLSPGASRNADPATVLGARENRASRGSRCRILGHARPPGRHGPCHRGPRGAHHSLPGGRPLTDLDPRRQPRRPRRGHCRHGLGRPGGQRPSPTSWSRQERPRSSSTGLLGWRLGLPQRRPHLRSRRNGACEAPGPVAFAHALRAPARAIRKHTKERRNRNLLDERSYQPSRISRICCVSSPMSKGFWMKRRPSSSPPPRPASASPA